MPWTVASRVFKANDLERAMGWARTLARVAGGDPYYEARELNLTKALEEHIMCGEKIVRIFDLDGAAMETLRTSARGLEVSGGPFVDAYPVLLGENELREQQGEHPVLTAMVEYPAGIAVVLASRRYLTTRETIGVAELSDAAAVELQEFSEVIGVRLRQLEAMDVIWIPERGHHVELRVDFPFGMQQRQGVAALDQGQASFERLLHHDFSHQQVNFFPVIQSLYEARGDGAMVELGFMVSGSAQKLERTRRDGQCCREEAYHVGGIGVLDAPIQPYRTSVMWQLQLTEGVLSAPEVSIKGTSAQTTEQNPFLGEMVIRNCANFEDYDHVRDRILDHL